MKELRLQTLDQASRRESQAQPLNPFAAAYSYGWSKHLCHQQARWDDMEPVLRRGWSKVSGNTGMSWEQAREAVRDGWEHVSPRVH